MGRLIIMLTFSLLYIRPPSPPALFSPTITDTLQARIKLGGKSLFALIFGALILAGCASTPPEEQSDARDRYENSNREIFAFNMKVDTYVLEPVASGYRTVVPKTGRNAVSNHLRWASLPSTAVNSTLQGKFENAGLATLHFLVNGLTLGLVDLVEDDAIVQKEDFGQTLAAANTPEGPYLMVPIMGPRTTRALAGDVVDIILNPLSVFGTGEVANTVRTAQAPMAAVDFRARTFDAFNDIKYNAIDSYARTRSLYYQSRAALLEDRVVPQSPKATSEDDLNALFED